MFFSSNTAVKCCADVDPLVIIISGCRFSFISYRSPSAWRTPLSIFCSAVLTVINSLCFLFIPKHLYFIIILKSIFTTCRIRGWWGFSFSILQVLFCRLLAATVSSKARNYFLIFVSLSIMRFFLFGWFHSFLFRFGFQKFDYDIPRCGFLYFIIKNFY
jgi:hypothetical protein